MLSIFTASTISAISASSSGRSNRISHGVDPLAYDLGQHGSELADEVVHVFLVEQGFLRGAHAAFVASDFR